jgi:hypothetical protein
MINWFKKRFSHKLQHLSWNHIKNLLKKHGIAFVIIVIGWEIIEDILFPVLFTLLGKYVHPIFYGGVPVSWLLCLHWIAVPTIWGFWLKKSRKVDCEHSLDERCNHD